MGAQLIKGYSIEGDTVAMVGINNSWKLMKGKKENGQKLASIFLIEKKQVKKNKEEVLRVAKKEASSLLKMRHPGILAIVQPLTEDENILAFVTQKIEGNLSHLIAKHKFSQYIASELELKLYLYPLLETVIFLHDIAKQAHLNIGLDSVYVSTDGKWKLGGFGYNSLLTGQTTQKCEEKIADYSFTAPELALEGTFNKFTDAFSIGVIILRAMEQINKQYKPSPIPDKQAYQTLKASLKSLSTSHPTISKSSTPTQLYQLLSSLLSENSSNRISTSQILSSGWFNDNTIVTVRYLDKISTYENKQQLQFLKGLAGVVDDFEERVLTKVIVGKLMDLLKFNHLVASIVFIIFDLLKRKKLPTQFFKKTIWSHFKAISQGKELTAQAIYILIYNMPLLDQHLDQTDITTYIMPLYLKCFDCPPKLKMLALSMLEPITKKVDYQYTKTRVIPKLVQTMKDANLDVRKQSLKGLYGILKVIDNQTIAQTILPAIDASRKVGADPFTNAIVNAIYNTLTLSLPSELIAAKILPILIPLLSDPGINREEFKQFKGTIFNMISKIQKDREKTFNNDTNGVTFSEPDFRIKPEEEKKPTAPIKDYGFLSNYIVKEKPKPKEEPLNSNNNNNNNNMNLEGLNFTGMSTQPISSQPISSQPIASLNYDIQSFSFQTKNEPMKDNFQIPTKQTPMNFDLGFQQKEQPIIKQKKEFKGPTKPKEEDFNFDYLATNPVKVETNFNMDSFNQFGPISTNKTPQTAKVTPASLNITPINSNTTTANKPIKKISKPKPTQFVPTDPSPSQSFGLSFTPSASGSNPFEQLQIQQQIITKKTNQQLTVNVAQINAHNENKSMMAEVQQGAKKSGQADIYSYFAEVEEGEEGKGDLI